MRSKYFALLALMLCIGAFLLPTTAFASENSNSPIVTATVEGEILRIGASGGFLGVEAIFINEQRFNFRVDGALSVDLLAFSDSHDLSVYAVDFAGNRSNVVRVTNPHYTNTETPQPPAPTTPPQGIPVTPSQPNPFTPAGQASVLDNATNDDEKEFFTFTTPAGNVFFLIVDRQRGTDNVYFLNAVTEQDLIALAEQTGTQISGSGTGGIPVATTPQAPDEYPDTSEPETNEPTSADSSGGNGTLIFLLVAIAVGGGAGYYIKIVRPKQQASSDYDDEDEDEEDIGEEMEFEDEPAESDDDYYNTDDELDMEDDRQ